MIHCIGDSHSCFFSGEDKIQPIWPEQSFDTLPYFRSYRILSCDFKYLTIAFSSNIFEKLCNYC